MQSESFYFTEKNFFEQFIRLIDASRAEDALDYLIENLPNIHKSKMNRKEKLKHLTFAGRLLQSAGLGKYGIEKVKQKAETVTAVVRKFGLSKRNTFVDFGCGAHEPLGLSTYFFANGFKKCVANDFLPIRNSRYAAMSQFDIVSYMKIFPEKFLSFGRDSASFTESLAAFDLDALRSGDFETGIQGLAGSVDFVSSNIVEAELEDSSVSLLVSFAVFEHVMDIDGVCAYLFNVTEPGGLHYHFVDLADHRSYRNDGFYNPFSFLTEEEGPTNINRLRASEHIDAFKRAGFEILSESRSHRTIDELTKENMLQKWKQMAEEDQTAVSLTVVLRKP